THEHPRRPFRPRLPGAGAPAGIHRRGRGQGARADRRRGQRRAQAARVHPGRRLLRLPVRLRVRRGAGRGRPGGGDRRRDPARRPAQPAVPDGRLGRLRGEPARRPVHHPQPEREVDLRLRQQLHGMTPRRAAPFAFVQAPLDRAENLRDDPDALARLWAAGRAIVLDAEGRAAATPAGQVLLAPPAARLGDPPPGTVSLGLRGDEGWFAVRAEVVADAGALEASVPIDLRSAAAQWPDFESTAFAQARAVLHWRARHRFCAACGTALAFARAGWLGRCEGCGLEHYPRTDPAVIVAVSDGGRLLLGRGAGWPPGRYSVLAGFVEPGESL